MIISSDFYMDIVEEYELTNNVDYLIPEAEICWNLIGLYQFMIPVFILIFKGNKDVFCSFSKLND